MDKMREEFEAWVYETFDIDCSEMSFGPAGSESKEQYINENDSDGAAVVSAMFYAWKASREALCVELPSFENGSIRGYSGDCDEARMVVDSVAESLDKAGVSYK